MDVRENGRGIFLAIEGVDGVGKSTLARHVGDLLAERQVKLLTRRNRPLEGSYVRQAMASLAELIWGTANGPQAHLLPPEYWLHLQAAWYAAYSRWVLQPALQEHAIVLVDGWFYKFLARFVVNGFDTQSLFSVFLPAGEPDGVVLVEVDVEKLWERRSVFKPSELGLHQGYAQLGRESFIEYQSRVAHELRGLARRLGWEVVPLRADTPVEVNARVVYAALERLIEVRLRSA